MVQALTLLFKTSVDTAVADRLLFVIFGAARETVTRDEMLFYVYFSPVRTEVKQKVRARQMVATVVRFSWVGWADLSMTLCCAARRVPSSLLCRASLSRVCTRCTQQE